MKQNLILISMFLLLFMQASGQTEQTRKKHLNIDKNGLAIKGYDPVAYFTEGKAREGKTEITHSFKGIIYRFATESNKNLFKENPEKYEPAYGGWCAYAMNYAGKKVEIDPETFKIIDGKNYLFYNFFFNNTLTDWNKNESVYKTKADQNWKKIIEE